MGKRKEPFWRAVLWFGLNLLFGLSPFWIIWFIGSLSSNNHVLSITQEQLHHLIRDCAILFICCVIMGAATVDFMFSKIEATKWAVFSLTLASILPLVF